MLQDVLGMIKGLKQGRGLVQNNSGVNAPGLVAQVYYQLHIEAGGQPIHGLTGFQRKNKSILDNLVRT